MSLGLEYLPLQEPARDGILLATIVAGNRTYNSSMLVLVSYKVKLPSFCLCCPSTVFLALKKNCPLIVAELSAISTRLFFV